LIIILAFTAFLAALPQVLDIASTAFEASEAEQLSLKHWAKAPVKEEVEQKQLASPSREHDGARDPASENLMERHMLAQSETPERVMGPSTSVQSPSSSEESLPVELSPESVEVWDPPLLSEPVETEESPPFELSPLLDEDPEDDPDEAALMTAGPGTVFWSMFPF